MWWALAGGATVQICFELWKIYRYHKERRDLIDLASQLALQSIDLQRPKSKVSSINDLPRGEYDLAGGGRLKTK